MCSLAFLHSYLPLGRCGQQCYYVGVLSRLGTSAELAQRMTVTFFKVSLTSETTIATELVVEMVLEKAFHRIVTVD